MSDIILVAENRTTVYEAANRLPGDDSMIDQKHSKYMEEQYNLGWNYTHRLQSGQSIASGTVTAHDVSGNDVSASMLGAVTATSPTLKALLKKNAGQRGQLYYLRYIAVTNDADELEQVLELEVV